MISFSTGKLRKKLIYTNMKFVFFFKCSNREKMTEKIYVKKLVKTSDEFVPKPKVIRLNEGRWKFTLMGY